MLRKLAQKDLDHATSILKQGGIIAMPTDTVYGLAGDASNLDAIHKIYEIKGRPNSKALSVLIPNNEAMSLWAKNIPDYAKQLADSFWPGAMTLVLPKQDHVHDILTGHTGNIGLRIPDNAMARQVLEAFGAVAAPSANSYGQISPTTASHVANDLGEKVDLILDGGICSLGLESTIIDCTGSTPVMLRQGFLTAEDIYEATGLTISEALHDADKRLDFPLTNLSLDAINQALTSQNDDECLVVISPHKPSCLNVVMHDARVPHRLNQRTAIDPLIKRHWILMPSDAAGFTHSFYEQLHFANQLLKDHPKGKILCEALPKEDVAWRKLALRLESYEEIKSP